MRRNRDSLIKNESFIFWNESWSSEASVHSLVMLVFLDPDNPEVYRKNLPPTLCPHVQVVTSFMTTSHPGQRKRLCRWTTIIHYNTIMCHRETWPVFFRNCFESHPHVAQFQPHPLNLVELFAAKQGLPLSNHGPPSPIHVGLWRGCCLTRGWVVWKNMSCVVHQCSSVRPMEEVQHMGHTFRFHSDLFCAQLLQVDDGRWWFPSFARLKPY